MIKVCTILNSYAPNKPGGGKSKICLQGDQGEEIFFSLQKFHSSNFLPSAFVERAFHCSWTTSEEKCMDGLCAVSSGFHRSMTHLKMIMAKLVTFLASQDAIEVMSVTD